MLPFRRAVARRKVPVVWGTQSLGARDSRAVLTHLRARRRVAIAAMVRESERHLPQSLIARRSSLTMFACAFAVKRRRQQEVLRLAGRVQQDPQG
jgi:hypothetical protein